MARPTARERAREQITSEILDVARRQLATEGAAGLSLRAIARELGFASSALYRYFASRDELLTRLIIESYDRLGDAAESALTNSVEEAPQDRWVAVGSAIRSWALRHPHEWALLYGSPVPGYSAPTTTVESGTRTTLALVQVVVDASRADDAGLLVQEPVVDVEADLSVDLARLRDQIQLHDTLTPSAVVGVVAGWSQLLGLVSLEVFGQTEGMVRADQQLFEHATRWMAVSMGLAA